MTEQHPLTDEIIHREFLPKCCYSEDDIRAAYDLAIELMSQWVEENGHEYVAYGYELGCQSNFIQMITDFKQAMRPTT